MPEFSVIVPVYKVEKYISRCIESILAQSFTDFELILVDDGSPDRSGEICEQYALLDNRICVIHQENRGVSRARNMGMKKAKGKYIVFVDGDDVVEENYLDCMSLVNYDVDLIICGVKEIDTDGTEHSKSCLMSQNILELNNSVILDLINSKLINYAVSKRFKRSILEKGNICFLNSINLGEDTLFVAEYLCVSKNVQCLCQTPYKYYKYDRNTLSSFDSNYVKKVEKSEEQIAECLENYYGNIKETRIWKERCFSVYYYSIFFVLRNKQYSMKDKYQLLKSIFKEKKFRCFAKYTNIYMNKDGAIIRNMIATKSPFLVLVIWELLGAFEKKKAKKWKC